MNFKGEYPPALIYLYFLMLEEKMSDGMRCVYVATVDIFRVTWWYLDLDDWKCYGVCFQRKHSWLLNLWISGELKIYWVKLLGLEMCDMWLYGWGWDRNPEDWNSSLAKWACHVEFTFCTWVLWSFLGVSGIGDLDVRSNTSHSSMTQEGKENQGD